MSPEDQIKALYEARSAYTDGQKGLAPEAGRERYRRELPRVLQRNKECLDRMGRFHTSKEIYYPTNVYGRMQSLCIPRFEG